MDIPRNKNIQITKTTSPPAKTSHSTIYNLKLLSWNIQASNNVVGNKFDDNEFIKLLNSRDIICLQEVCQANTIPGFRLIHNLRTTEKDGGVSILFRNEFKDGIKRINKYKMNDILICKLKKSFFKFDYDIFIINTYIPPYNSTRKCPINGNEMLANISEIVNELSTKGEIILCGDFNTRISNHPGFIEHDDCNELIPMPSDYIPNTFIPRQSKDRHKNPFTKDFISLVLNNNLTILNGRTLGDLSGSFTSINHNGCSVIDYFITTAQLSSQVILLEVNTLTHFSDHCPLQLTLKTNHLDFKAAKPLSEIFDTAPNRYIFDESSKTKFFEAQENDLFNSSFNSIKEKISYVGNNYPSRNDIISLNQSYVTYLQEMATFCCKSTTTNPKKSSVKQKNAPWFNKNCHEAKKQLRKAARATSSYAESEFLRKNYYHVKKFYKNLISKQKKRIFLTK